MYGKPFKMKGSPMQRNFGISPMKASPATKKKNFLGKLKSKIKEVKEKFETKVTKVQNKIKAGTETRKEKQRYRNYHKDGYKAPYTTKTADGLDGLTNFEVLQLRRKNKRAGKIPMSDFKDKTPDPLDEHLKNIKNKRKK